MKKRNIFIIVAVCLILGAFALYKYIYQGHRDIATEEVSFSVPVETISREFAADQNLANNKYADKTISVAGTVTSLDTAANTIIINEKMSVIFTEPTVSNLKQSQQIEVKGRFVGYDDLLEELKMDKASIIK